MSRWTKEKLEQMIADKVEENLTVEYKRAESLAKTDGRKTELTKDVSAFANSSGGVVIYGIAEPQDKAKRHLPERLDPVRRADISKEWLEQVIQTVQPRIDGVVIHPVAIDEQAGLACYVVEVPKSHTAHQARDHVYYKRHNFNVLAMEDYEVRDVMNRRTHPKIRASIFVNKRAGGDKPEGVVLVKLENVGRVIARYVMVQLELPVDMDGQFMVEAPVLAEDTDEGRCHLLRLVPGFGQAPIFPGSDVTLRRTLHTGTTEIMDRNGEPVTSARHVKVSVFADEMPPLHATLEIAPVLLGWTPLGQAGESRG
jgi:Putative DNA-binding domain